MYRELPRRYNRASTAVVAYLAANKLEIASTLRITVASTVLGTSSVAGVLGRATIGIHGDKVQGRVEAALDLRQVDIKRQLIVGQGEGLVGVGVLHEIGTGADVLAVLMLRDEPQVQSIAAGGDAVGAAVVGSLDGTVVARGAGAGTGPFVSIIAVLSPAL